MMRWLGAGHRLRLVTLGVAVLLAGVTLVQAPARAAVVQPVGDAKATVETTPVPTAGDAADDPAIWANAADPARSAVIGNDKGGGLEVYDLAGTRIQRISEGFFGNVDVRKGFATATGTIDLVVTYRLGVRVYRIDPATRQLTNATDTTSGSITTPFSGEGICLYRSPTSGSTYAFANARTGQVAQYELTDRDGDGLVEGTKVREWDVGTEVEGCVANDRTGDLYISEEGVGIWKYGAEPTAPTTPASRVLVDSVTSSGGHLIPDVEGLTIVYQPGGTGYLLASSQAASNTLNNYAVYELQGSNAFIRTFKVVNGTTVDGCGRTDGIDAFAGDLGPSFPKGMFVCQDNNNTVPGGTTGNQNFKFVPLERVVGLTPDQPPINQPPHAVLQANCTGLSCTASAAGSADPDGTITSYTWDFGDGAVGSGPTVSHTYAAAGARTITLTVTDNSGATGNASQMVTVAPVADPIRFVGSATSNVNATTHSVTVPAAVTAGDGLLLFFSSNTTGAISDPAGVPGWHLLDTLTGPSATTKVWSKVAGSADPGSVVRLTVTGGAKANMVVAAYHGTSEVSPVAAFARASDAAGKATHVTPVAQVSGAASWAISYWTHKDSTTDALSVPDGVTARASGAQTGSGRVAGLIADSGASVPVGSYGGLSSTAAATGSNATMWTIILAPTQK